MFAFSRSHFAWVTLAYGAVIGLVLYPGFHERFGAKLMLWNCIPPTIAFIVTVTALGKSRRRFILSATFASLAAAVTTLFAAAWLFTSLDTDPHSSTTAIVFVFAPVWSLAVAMIGSGLVWFATRTTSITRRRGSCGIFLLAVLTFCWGCSFLHASHIKSGEKSRPTVSAEPIRDLGEIERGPRGKSEIAVTFDAGADAECFEDLIAALESAHVHSTFFITGNWAQRNRDCAEAITKHGHEVGNHTWNHFDLTKQSDEVVREEVTRAEVLLTPEFLIDRITRKSDSELDGAIILMHAGEKSTADALPAIIANLQGRGFHLVTVSKLLESAPKAQ